MINLVRKNIFFIFLVLGVVVIIFFTLQKNESQSEKNVVTETLKIDEESTEKESVMLVDIKGEIVTPGVYEMTTGARVKDVVLEAGGFTNDADENFINLAQKVMDEMVIIVPTKGVSDNQSTGQNVGTKVRINYASVDEIQQLPGIGPSKAKAIVEYRDENGFFTKVEDLLEVSGIGEKTLEALIEVIQVP